MYLRLAEERRRAGLKQTELAEKAGISPNYISEIESGKIKNPGIWYIYHIARALRIQVDDLIDDEQEQKGGGSLGGRGTFSHNNN